MRRRLAHKWTGHGRRTTNARAVRPLRAGKEKIMQDTVVCQNCKKHFRMGVSGTVDGCDKCTGVKRDKNGYAWYPDEKEQTYEPIGGSEKDRFTVNRAQTFSKGAG
jgi:hypothetical protein